MIGRTHTARNHAAHEEFVASCPTVCTAHTYQLPGIRFANGRKRRLLKIGPEKKMSTAYMIHHPCSPASETRCFAYVFWLNGIIS